MRRRPLWQPVLKDSSNGIRATSRLHEIYFPEQIDSSEDSTLLDVWRILVRYKALYASARFADAIVIVHGDHGSRISRSQYIEHMSAQELIANHAALFAIKKPRVQPGYDLEYVSLQDLFARHVSFVAGHSRGDAIVVESAKTG
ncbi:MAG: hypothetical protein ACRD8U_08590 [Pyrinomonadaceae bacterium]